MRLVDFSKPSFVYFIQGEITGCVKIGVARDPALRLKTLQTGCAERLFLIRSLPGDRRLERWLHKRFAALRVRGEWFRFSSEMKLIEPNSDLAGECFRDRSFPEDGPRATLIRSVEDFCLARKISPQVLAARVLNDRKFWFRLVNGQNVSLRNIERIEAAIEAPLCDAA